MNGPQAPHRADSAEVTIRRTETPGNGSRVVAPPDRPPALQNVAVPSRDRSVRRTVVDLFERCPHLTEADVYAAARLCHLYRKIERIGKDLQDRGLFKADGDPRKAISEWRQLMAEARAHEAALGITAAARAALGVDISRMRSMDPAGRAKRLRAEGGRNE